MAVTIRDIARESGFSISTVSRALANPEHVAEATRVEIQAVASRMGYRVRSPGPVVGAHYRIGLVVPDLENPFFGSICKGAQSRARALNCTVLVADTDEDVATESDVAHEVASRVDGVVLCSPRMSDAEIRELAAQTPLALANRHIDGMSSIIFDNATGMEATLRHLVALGHHRIAYAGGPVASWSNTQRANAFNAFANAGHADAVEFVDLGNFPPYFQGGVQAADLVVADGASAIIAYNDIMALGLMDRLGSRGLSVPQDISVTGFDNVAMCMFVRPNLTTVNLPRRLLGKASIDLLYGAIQERSGMHRGAAGKHADSAVGASRTLSVDLRIRQSSMAPPQAAGKGRTTARAQKPQSVQTTA